MGSGAGVPGIPLAIAEPEREFTLIESRGKRARFLRHVQGRLGLQNVIVEHSRVEDLPGVPPFDTVLARAVAALPELLRITRHLFGPDTVMLALTGESFSENLSGILCLGTMMPRVAIVRDTGAGRPPLEMPTN